MSSALGPASRDLGHPLAVMLSTRRPQQALDARLPHPAPHLPRGDPRRPCGLLLGPAAGEDRDHRRGVALTVARPSAAPTAVPAPSSWRSSCPSLMTWNV